MFIAHLPAGYIASRWLRNTRSPAPVLIGSVAPDLDLLLVYFGGIQMHHHLFVTHRPVLWVGIALIGLLLKRWWVAGLGIGGLVHLCLDSVAGRINWLWPLADGTVVLVDVPARYDWWVWSFILHPVFLIELTICAAAFAIWQRARHRDNKKPRR